MSSATLADWIDIFLVNPIGRFLLVMILLLGNFALAYLLCLAYLRLKGLPLLERPTFGDRNGGLRIMWQLLTMRDKPDMGSGLKVSLLLNRLLAVSLALCMLDLALNFVRGMVAGH